jgi:hypothetical protein
MTSVRWSPLTKADVDATLAVLGVLTPASMDAARTYRSDPSAWPERVTADRDRKGCRCLAVEMDFEHTARLLVTDVLQQLRVLMFEVIRVNGGQRPLHDRWCAALPGAFK